MIKYVFITYRRPMKNTLIITNIDLPIERCCNLMGMDIQDTSPHTTNFSFTKKRLFKSHLSLNLPKNSE